MFSIATPTDLSAAVFRWRRALYALAFLGMAPFAAIGQDPRALTAAGIFAVAWGSDRGRWVNSAAVRALLVDVGVAVGLWWLYGPVSGAAFLAFGVVAVAPFLLDRFRSRLVLVVVLLSVPLRVALHFLAGDVEIPLFHPDDPISHAEFLTGEVIQAVLLLGVGALMLRLAGILGRGQEALTADLERERELSELKDRFVATVSHQLRTPLTTLKGFTTSLLESEHEPAEQTEFLTIMSDQAEELHNLIEDLITFSRIGAGGVTIRSEAIDLRGIVAEVVSGLGSRASGVGNDVLPGVSIHADPPRLRQILRNLIDNAIKYGAPPIVVRAIEDGGAVRFRILDGGSGMSPDKMHIAFQPYSRLVDNRTMSQPGVGLGLPIVRELVMAHGGTVRPVTEDDMSGFEISLPTSKPPSDGAATESACPPPDTPSGCVLQPGPLPLRSA